MRLAIGAALVLASLAGATAFVTVSGLMVSPVTTASIRSGVPVVASAVPAGRGISGVPPPAPVVSPPVFPAPVVTTAAQAAAPEAPPAQAPPPPQAPPPTPNSRERHRTPPPPLPPLPVGNNSHND